jgi:hypothetical protein
MTLSTLVSEVQQKVQVPRDEILRRAREAWPATIDFKPVQVSLLAHALLSEASPKGRVAVRQMSCVRQ